MKIRYLNKRKKKKKLARVGDKILAIEDLLFYIFFTIWITIGIYANYDATLWRHV